jgi:tetratricopeptide (TPR) repeat protein
MLNRVEMLKIIVIVAVIAPLAAAAPENDLVTELDRAIGDPVKIRQIVSEITARPRVKLDVLLQAGIKLAEREMYPEAAHVFSRAVKDYPNSFEAHYNLALSHFALQKLGEARAALNGLSNLTPQQQLARDYLLGKILDATGDHSLAERNLAAAFAGAPLEENYALDLGLFYLRHQNYARAVSTLEIGVKHHPQSLFLGLGLGLAQVFGDHPSQAVATSKRVLAIDPAFAPARLLMTIAYYMNGENENCVREAEAALRRPSGVIPYLYYLHAAALLRLNSKEYGRMLQDLDTAIRQIPACSFCYFAASKVHQAKGDEAAAIADLETLVSRVDPEFSQGWYRLSTLYQHAGRPDEAASALARFRAIKTAETDGETEYLRKLFLSALGGK